MVNFLFNLEKTHLMSAFKSVWVKTSTLLPKEEKIIYFPELVKIYNKTHNYIDSVKHVISKCKNTLRARKSWRVKLNSWMYVLLSNAFHYFKIVKNYTTGYCFASFITNVITTVATQKPKYSTLSSPENTIRFHTLNSDSKHKRKRCFICKEKTSWFCMDCESQLNLCQYPCAIQFHNSNKEFLFF